MPAEGRENPLLKKGNSDAFFREKYLTKNNTGYKVTAIDVGGTPVAVQNNGGDYVYNFIMPSVNVVVSVTFGPA